MGRSLFGEVNLKYRDQMKFFGGAEGDELSMQFDFEAMERLYLSLARENAKPLSRMLARPRSRTRACSPIP